MIALIVLLACPQWLRAELPTIIPAAERNGVLRNTEDFRILLAIRIVERGGPGREFGIMNAKAHNLNLQAAWAACTVRNHRIRHKNHNCGLDFLECLGNRYCPPDAHPLNKNWLPNMRYWLTERK